MSYMSSHISSLFGGWLLGWELLHGQVHMARNGRETWGHLLEREFGNEPSPQCDGVLVRDLGSEASSGVTSNSDSQKL